jgi:cytochrome c oxidase subunit 2
MGVSLAVTRIMNFRGVIATDEDNTKQGRKYTVIYGVFYAMMIYCLILHERNNVTQNLLQ